MLQTYHKLFWRSLLTFPIIGLINLSGITLLGQSQALAQTQQGSQIENAVIQLSQRPELPTPRVTKITRQGQYGLANGLMGDVGRMMALIHRGGNWEVIRLPGGVANAKQLNRPSGIPVNIYSELLSQHLGNSSQIIAQSTEVPMTLEFGEGMYTMTVPNRDTTQSAYGGQLSLYDVHIAKMFEITYDDCQQMQRQYGRDAGGRSWFYKAGNGNIDMGEFYMSCNLADQIVDTYGLGQPEQTVVKNFVEFSGVNTETRSIPILDITGSKVSQWINFVQGFKPRR